VQHKDEQGRSEYIRQITRSAVIEGLRQRPVTRGMSCDALRMVMGIRLLAICNRAGQDPLLELIQRFGNIEAAKRFIDFADNVGKAWPEPVRVMRPCYPISSPDEFTIAGMADAARSGNRVRFENNLSGFVSPEYYEAMFDRAARAVAAFD